MTISELKEVIEAHGQVFLTGAGGTGKTYTLEALLPRFSNPIKLATTNSAAVRIGGDTVHAAFKLGLANSLQELEAEDDNYYEWFRQNVVDDMEKARGSRIKLIRELLRYCDLLVIDEVSMLSASTFSLLFHRARQCRMALPPLLMIGDLYQLPPVETEYAVVPQEMIYHSQYFKPKIIELTEIKRTENIEFAKAQKSIRRGKYTEFVHNVLDKITKNEFPDDFNPTILVSNNTQADMINRDRLDALPTQDVTIPADIETSLKSEKKLNQIIRQMPPDKILRLKLGARVMFIQNDKEQGYYNGLQGVVTNFVRGHDNSIASVTVLADNGKEYSVWKTSFDKKRLKETPVGVTYEVEVKMSQVPLKVCYAMTIHKSQGSSIKQLEINCSRIFASGQFYVAISRAIDPTQVRIRNLRPDYIRIKNPDLDAYIEANAENILYTPAIEDDALKVKV